MKPKLSVIVPVYNVERYLHRCIDSILNQTFKDFELILINDGSTDKSGTICDYYKLKDTRVRVIHKQNNGVSISRNLGLKKSKGEFISFIDSDDYINKYMFESLINIITSENADIACCSFKRVEANVEQCSNNNINHIKIYTAEKALEDYLSYKCEQEKHLHTVLWNKIYKRELFDNIEFPSNKIFEDGYVMYKLLGKSNKIVFLDSIYYYYVQRPKSIMKTISPINHLKTYDDWCLIYRYLCENFPHLSIYALSRYIYKDLDLYKNIKYMDINDNLKNYYRSAIKEQFLKDFKKIITSKIGIKEKLKVTKIVFLG